jgi:genome maintenance exonuclease 1
MKYILRDISTISAHGMRLYNVSDGVYYPSITTVLGSTVPEEKKKSLESWRDSIGHAEADRIGLEAATNGTEVHEIIEKYLNGDKSAADSGHYSRDQIMSFNAIKAQLSYIDEVWAQEAALYSHELGVAGRCDCIGIHRGMPAIIDFKTSSKLKKSKDIQDYYLQLTAYGIMFNEMYGTDISRGVIIMVSAKSFPQEFRINLKDFEQQLKGRVSQFYATFLNQ